MALVESAADVDETRLSTTQNPITSEVEMANVAAAAPPPVKGCEVGLAREITASRHP